MTLRPWLKNGRKLMDGQGRPILCDRCPCPSPLDCDALIATLVSQCSAMGAYCLHKTGWLYSTVDTSHDLVPCIFQWIDWEYDETEQTYACNLKYLDCDCEASVLATATLAAPPVSPADFGYAFLENAAACDNSCENTIATLVAQAVANGWTLHGEGVLARKTSSLYSCYRFDTGLVRVQACADTGESFIYISCDCNRVVLDSNYSLYAFIAHPSCSCFDMRELLLSYPDEFGVADVSFGDDTVYTRAPASGTTYTYSCLRSNHGWDTYYCDYRRGTSLPFPAKTTLILGLEYIAIASNTNFVPFWSHNIPANTKV